MRLAYVRHSGIRARAGNSAAIVQGDHLSYEARWRNRLGPNLYFGMRNRNLLASRPMAEHLLRMLRQNPDMGLSFFKLL